jgi:hypothetical protein
VRVVLTGTEHTGGLAALRALEAAGHHTWVAAVSPDAYGARSNAAAGVVFVPDPRLDPRGFAERVADTAAAVAAHAVLPGTEGALLALSTRAGLFDARVGVGVCPPALTAAATDKVAALAAAAGAGVHVLPATVLGADGPTDLQDVRYPAIVKPLRSELPVDGRLRRFEVRRAADAEELQGALSALPEGVGIVQTHVQGRLRTVNGVAWNGEVVAEVHKVGLRTWPAGCGPVSAAQTVAIDPALSRQARALMAALGWSGIFNLQFIESGAECFLIDVNPRVYTSIGLAVAAGMNLPAIWADLLIGRRPLVRPYRVGVRFRSEDDVRSLAQLFRSGAVRDALGGIVPHRGTAHGIVSLSDPRPGLAYARRLPRRLLPT